MTARNTPELPSAPPPGAAGVPCSLQQPLPVAAQAQGQPAGEMSPAPAGLTSAASAPEGVALAAELTPGGRVATDAARLPGTKPRTWRIELPAGMKVLSMNGRLHWSEQRRRAAALKEAAWAVARSMHIPALEHAFITIEYQPPDKRRRDHDNIPAASGKHCIDGITAAGVLADDCPPYVSGLSYKIGDPYPRGRLVLIITELAS